MIRYALLRTVLDPLLAVSSHQGVAHIQFLPKAWEYHTRAHALARVLAASPVAMAAQSGGNSSECETSETTGKMSIIEDSAAFEELREQLADYFVGRTQNFSLCLDLRGTEFQIKVWKQILQIPYGQLRTYGEIAKAMDQPKATRAVGQAAGQNPLPIVIPCHRVVGRDGRLIGFARGISTKARMLRLEGHTLGDTSRIEEPRLF